MSSTRFNVIFDDELLKKVDSEAKKIGMNRSEFLRNAAEEKMARSSTIEGMDITLKMMRKVVQDELRPLSDRLAKMIAKDTKASATGMNLLLLYLMNDAKVDVAAYMKQAEKQAVILLNSREVKDSSI